MTRRALLSLGLLATDAACNNGGQSPVVTGPTGGGPVQPTALFQRQGAWSADATVVAADAPRYSSQIGRTFSTDWSVSISGNSVWLDEGAHNYPTDDWPFQGVLDQQQFTATYVFAQNAVSVGSCRYSPTVLLSGTFNPDFTAFDAVETATATSDSSGVVQTFQLAGRGPGAPTDRIGS